MSLYASRLDSTQLASLGSEPSYDLAVVSVGFEERSRAIAGAISPPGLGVGLEFPDRHEEAYEENRRTIAMLGYDVITPATDSESLVEEVASWIESASIRRPPNKDKPFRAAIDISSMTRTRIAAIIEACYAQEFPFPAIVDLLYAPASYRPSDPPLASLMQANPVSERFAGWDPDTSKPLLSVIGLGYEPSAAEVVVEYLSPDEKALLVPMGRDPRYQVDVEQVNSELIDKADLTLKYRVEDPYRLMLELERLVLARIDHRRILFVPLGPKIFAAACMLVAERLHPLVSVWRFSAGSNDGPRAAAAAGPVCGIRLSTSPEHETP